MKNKKNNLRVLGIVAISLSILFAGKVVASSFLKDNDVKANSKNKNYDLITKKDKGYSEDSLYRSIFGKITSIKKDRGNNTILTILLDENEKPTTVTLKITKDTKNNTENLDLKKGLYINAQYTQSKVLNEVILADEIELIDFSDIDFNVDEIIDEEVIHTGKIVNIWFNPENKNSGSITIISDAIGGEWIFNFDKDTKISEDLNSLKTGDKLKIIAGSLTALSYPPQSSAIEIAKIGADDVIHSGKITDIWFNPNDENSGSVTIVRNIAGDKWVFNFNKDTKSTVELKSLKIGDKLEILTNSLVSTSNPPQSTAIEILKIVKDKVIYTGKIVDIWFDPDNKNSGSITILRDFTGDKWIFNFNKDTKTTSELKSLKVGDELEIITNSLVYPSNPPQSDAIEIFKIVNDKVIYTGKISEIWFNPENKNSGSITIVRDVIGDEWVFNFNKDTKLSLDIKSLKIGDKLKIITNSIVYTSNPPQSDATEIFKIGADDVIHTGKITDIWFNPDNKNSGSITIISDIIFDKWVFNFNNDTKTSLDLNTLKTGDKLEILTNSITALSSPPQSSATKIEILK